MKITEAIRRYGVSDDTKELFVVRIDRPIPNMQEKMISIVEGDLSSMNDLARITDWASIKKVRAIHFALLRASSP